MSEKKLSEPVFTIDEFLVNKPVPQELHELFKEHFKGVTDKKTKSEFNLMYDQFRGVV